MMTYIIIFITAIVSIACFRNEKLFSALAFSPYRVVKFKEWYRVITHGFVHADYMHLIVNMLVLFSFGVHVELRFRGYAQAEMIGNGDINYILLYFGGVVIASINDLIKQRKNPMYRSIGASGAVAAVVFTSIFFNPWGMIYFFAIIPIPGIIFGVFYLLYAQYMVKQNVGNINHNAHFYGAIYGFIFPILMNPDLIDEFIRNFSMR